jgi:sRNA-binding regulator protein Hfq
MGSLEELAREKFGELSAAEKKVVQAAPDGTTADCRLGGGDDPAKADTWPASRNVRADLIRLLCVDREARGQVDPKGVCIWAARITGDLDLSFTSVLLPLALWRCRLEQDLDLGRAKMAVLNMEGSWTGGIFADGLKLEGDIFLRNGFVAEGEVRLLGATIGGNLDAEGGTFKNLKSEENPNSTGNALSADGITVTGDVFLRNGFHADGEVRLLGATIGGNLEADDGTFKNLKSDKNPNSTGRALSADRIEVTGSVFLRNGFSAEGKVRLHGAEIKGYLVVEDAWLDALVLESAHVTGPFFWRNIHKGSDPRFPNKEWEPSLDLLDAKVGALADQEASWPEKGGLILDGFVYDRIAAGPTEAKVPTEPKAAADAQVPINATARLRWLRLQPKEDGYLPQPYEQLIAVMRRMGHEDQVAEVAIAKQQNLYEHGDLGWWGKFWNRFRYRVIGCGYKPWWAFGWMAALVFAGTLVFLLARLLPAPVMVPSDKEAYQSDQKTELATPPHYYPQFNALVYSIDVIVPFDLGQKSHWRLHQRWSWDFVYLIFEVYSLFQLFLGWVLLLVAAAVPAGYIKKD